MVYAVLILLLAYVLGSIPTGYWVAKAAKGIDIRQFGSGSTGATNVWRCVGKKEGAFVFVFDILKGYFPVALAVWLDSGSMAEQWGPLATPHLVPALVAGSALIGHSKSIFLHFQGGKSAATGLGTLFGLNPLAGLITLVSWASFVGLTKIVSLASMLAVVCATIAFIVLQAPVPFTVYCAAGSTYVIIRHRANIKRLLSGTEPRLGDKPKELTQPQASATEPEASTADPTK
jgi:glycerol-3-phosphate acyltransferase PlsY